MKKINVVCLICCLVLTTGCDWQKKNKDKVKESKEEKISIQDSGKLPDKKVQGLSFTKTSISYVEDMATFVSTVKNTTNKAITLEIVEVIIKDKKGNVLTTIPGFLSEKLEPGEEKQFTAYVNMDLSKATDVEYKL